MNQQEINDYLREFLLECPLYDGREVDTGLIENIFSGTGKIRFDGHCVGCGKESVYTHHLVEVVPEKGNQTSLSYIRDRLQRLEVLLACQRNPAHIVRFYIQYNNGYFTKIGQYPSLADIANDALKDYRKDLSKADASELHKAVGLAAHGVGVGSFVYLRRVFERLLNGRFEYAKDSQGWNESDYYGLRMGDKIGFLEGFIPEFLSDNAKIYSILSLGIHELTEEQCLKAFDFLHESILIILEDDKKKREQLEQRKRAETAIAGFAAFSNNDENTQ